MKFRRSAATSPFKVPHNKKKSQKKNSQKGKNKSLSLFSVSYAKNNNQSSQKKKKSKKDSARKGKNKGNALDFFNNSLNSSTRKKKSSLKNNANGKSKGKASTNIDALLSVSHELIPRTINFVPPRQSKNARPTASAYPALNPSDEIQTKPGQNKTALKMTGLKRSIRNGDDFPYAQKSLYSTSQLHQLVAWKKIIPLGSGLYNLGNTCFLNATIQVLMYTPPLANYLLSRHHSSHCCVKSRFCLFCELEKLIAQSFKRKSHQAVAPNSIVKNIRSISKRFRPGRQEDSHEFIRFFLDKLQDNFLASFKNVKKLDERIKETSVVYRIFGGYFRSQVKCMSCGYESNKYDPFMDISLEVARAESVKKALRHFTAAEYLDGDNKYMCCKCKVKVRARKQLTVFKPPTILVINLKRFEFAQMWGGGKINRMVSYDHQLNLGPYLSESNKKKKVSATYSLYGVLVHSGSSPHSGHYYSFVKASNDQWHRMDDSHTERASRGTALKQKAYILFYLRDTVPVLPFSPYSPAITSSTPPKPSKQEAKAALEEFSLSPGAPTANGSGSGNNTESESDSDSDSEGDSDKDSSGGKDDSDESDDTSEEEVDAEVKVEDEDEDEDEDGSDADWVMGDDVSSSEDIADDSDDESDGESEEDVSADVHTSGNGKGDSKKSTVPCSPPVVNVFTGTPILSSSSSSSSSPALPSRSSPSPLLSPSPSPSLSANKKRKRSLSSMMGVPSKFRRTLMVLKSAFNFKNGKKKTTNKPPLSPAPTQASSSSPMLLSATPLKNNSNTSSPTSSSLSLLNGNKHGNGNGNGDVTNYRRSIIENLHLTPKMKKKEKKKKKKTTTKKEKNQKPKKTKSTAEPEEVSVERRRFFARKSQSVSQFGAVVSQWGDAGDDAASSDGVLGQRTKLMREIQGGIFKERRADEWDDELDRGRVKKVKAKTGGAKAIFYMRAGKKSVFQKEVNYKNRVEKDRKSGRGHASSYGSGEGWDTKSGKRRNFHHRKGGKNSDKGKTGGFRRGTKKQFDFNTY